jgi:flagellin
MTVVSGFVRDASGVSVKTAKYALDNTATGNTLFGVIDAAGAPDTTGILGTTSNLTHSDGTTIAAQSVFTLNIMDSDNDATADDAFDADQMADALTMVEDALKAMTSAAAELGSISMRIDLQEDFVAKLSDSIESGIGRLVDADMNEESTRLKALQTQQQLGIQSLSIANSSSENILSLFR